jgi:Kef-type K+ transport system membrane component KefB
VARFSHRLRLPAIVGYLLAGLLLGPSFLGMFSRQSLEALHVLNEAALGVIALIIGREIHLEAFRKNGPVILSITIAQQLATVLLVAAGVYLVSGSPVMALLLGALASASAPAGTAAVLQEQKADGPLTRTLYAVVGIDDGFAIVLYSLAVVASAHFIHAGSGAIRAADFLFAFREIGAAVILGIVFGALLGKAIRKTARDPDILELLLGSVILCAGIAIYFHASLILANLTLGLVVANFFPESNKKIEAMVNLVSLPVYVLFFIIAGAHLEISLLPSIGILGVVYILCRVLGKLIGSYTGAVLSGAPPVLRKYVGPGILSQAGVAVGLAVSLTNTFPSLSVDGTPLTQVILNVVIGSTVFFEIGGPIGVQYALSRSGESGQNAS